MTRFALYLARWQLSTPILWLVVSWLGAGLGATVVANLVGASIFFWVDQFIFRAKSVALWETVSEGVCADCQEPSRVRRLVFAPSAGQVWYDKREDDEPEYRCGKCAADKLRRLQQLKRVARSVAVA